MKQPFRVALVASALLACGGGRLTTAAEAGVVTTSPTALRATLERASPGTTLEVQYGTSRRVARRTARRHSY